jgi:hypothetical protein
MNSILAGILAAMGRLVQTDRPAWRATPAYKKRKHGRANPFQSTRRREPGALQMKVREFTSKRKRNSFFQEARKAFKDVTKWSTVRGNRSIWCVAYN